MNMIETIKLMLDALENHTAIKHPQQVYYRESAIKAGKTAIAEAKKQEGNVCGRCGGLVFDFVIPQPKREPLTDEQKSILNFLLGASDFDGVWYGERHPQKKDAFWWRNELRKAFQEAAHGIKGD